MGPGGARTATLPGLRDPASLPSPRAIGYWTYRAVVRGLLALGAEVAVAVPTTGLRPAWWLTLGLTALVMAVYAVIMPRWRYRVHRWEVTSEAVYTRTGWISVYWSIAPISRIQTIDSHRSPALRLFGLATVTVTTASAEGHLYIGGLDRATADRLIDELTIATARTPGDAT